jgi:hypothetical protein
VNCDATTMLSVQTGDRPTKLSQMFKISASVEAMGSGTVDELTWSHTMRSSASPAAAADTLKRCGKTQFNSSADMNGRDHPLSGYRYEVGIRAPRARPTGKAAGITDNPPYSIPPYSVSP